MMVPHHTQGSDHLAGQDCATCAQAGVRYPSTIRAEITSIMVHHPNHTFAGTYLTGFTAEGAMVQSTNSGAGVITWQPCAW